MTRVAGIPGELQALAATLVGSAPELEIAAGMLAAAARSLPSMPGGVAAEVESSISQAQTLVSAAAGTAANEGQDLKRRGLWLEIFDRIKAGWEPASTAFAMVAAPNDTIGAIERWRAVRLLHVWQDYREAVSPAVAAEGETSLGALNAQLQFEEDNPMSPARFATVIEGAGDQSAYVESLGSLATVTETIGRFTPYAGVIGGTLEAVRPMHTHGGLMVADRTAGLTTALGSGALIAGEIGLVALAPEAVPFILGAIAVAGAWELYENRAEVARLAVSGAKFIANHSYVLAGPGGIAAHEAWKYRAPIAHALVSTAETGKNLAEDGAKTIADGAVSEGKSFVSTGKSILGHVTPHVSVGGLHFG